MSQNIINMHHYACSKISIQCDNNLLIYVPVLLAFYYCLYLLHTEKSIYT